MEALSVSAEEKRSRLQLLREEVGAIDGSQPRAKFNAQFVGIDIPKGSVVEILGSAQFDFMARFLAEHSELPAVWVEEEFSLYPFALAQRGVNLSNTLFVETGKHSVWTFNELLQSQSHPILIAVDCEFSDKCVRKLQLLAERSESTVFLLQREWRPSWVPSLVLRVERDDQSSLSVNVIRKRGVL